MLQRLGYLFLLSVLLAFPFSASAQTNCIGCGVWGDAKVASSYTGPIDIVASPTALYSLRAGSAAIAAAATQKLINIRNTSTSETCDVIVATSGGFGNVANCSGSSSGDTVAVFCAESGGSCAVTKWYDQSGSGHDISQSTAASQPTLTLNCLGSLPCVTFSGSQVLGASFSTGTTMTHSFVGERTSHVTSNGTVANNSNTNSQIGFSNSANTLYIGNQTVFATGADNAWHAVQGIIGSGASASTINVDNASIVTGTITGQSGSSFTLGAFNNSAAAPLYGAIPEYAIWSGITFNSTQQTNICHNEYAYWGTSTAC